MTTELTMLTWSVVLGLVHAIATGQVTTLQHGLAYGMSPRDQPKPVTGVGARIQRAFANYMQTFPFFAAAVIVAQFAGVHTRLTVTGAELYFWARLVYVPLYAFGIPAVRTIAFLAATLGIAMILVALR